MRLSFKNPLHASELRITFHSIIENIEIILDHSLYAIENQFSGTLNYDHHQTEN